MAKNFKESKVVLKVMEDKKAKNSLTLNHLKEDASAEDIVTVRESIETVLSEPFTTTNVVQTYDID